MFQPYQPTPETMTSSMMPPDMGLGQVWLIAGRLKVVCISVKSTAKADTAISRGVDEGPPQPVQWSSSEASTTSQGSGTGMLEMLTRITLVER